MSNYAGNNKQTNDSNKDNRSNTSKIPDKKKNDLLRKFLNAQQYTKTLKVIFHNLKYQKNASHLIEESIVSHTSTNQINYTTYSYDEIQTYPEIPQSAKLPSTSKQLSIQQKSRLLLTTSSNKQPFFSIDTINNNSSQDFKDFSVKAKSKKSHGHINLTQSSNEIPYTKNKKSSYSHFQKEKSQGGNNNYNSKSISLIKDVGPKGKDYDVQSMNKEMKYTGQALHESLGGMKTESFFKLKNKKSFNYSNLGHEYQSEKLSAQDGVNSFQRVRKGGSRMMEDDFVERIRGSPDKNKAKNDLQSSCPYDLSPGNFLKLINKIEQLESVISLFQESIIQMKKILIQKQQRITSQQMTQLFIDSLKEELLEEKTKSAQLRQKVHFQESHIKEYEQVMMGAVENIGKFYEDEMKKMVGLEKENHFLKFMLRLELTENPENDLLKKNHLSADTKDKLQKEDDDIGAQTGLKMQITKNLIEFKEKFSKSMSQKSKSTIPH